MVHRTASGFAALMIAAACAAMAPTLAASKPASPAVKGPSSEKAAVGEWPSYGGTNWSQKYSPLDQVTKDNFKDLKVAWTWDSPDLALLPTIPANPEAPLNANGMKATPLLVNGVMYLSTGLGEIAAVDPSTGKTKWLYNPEAYKNGAQADFLRLAKPRRLLLDGRQGRRTHPDRHAGRLSDRPERQDRRPDPELWDRRPGRPERGHPGCGAQRAASGQWRAVLCFGGLAAGGGA